MKKKPCEFCEVEQFIMINGKDALMSIEFYPDNALFDVVASAYGKDALMSIEFYPDNALFDVVASAYGTNGKPTEVAWQETFEYCPKCGRKLR